MEYTGSKFGDKRLDARLRALGAVVARGAKESLPKLLTTEAELTAAYRFLNNDKVTFERLLQPHARATMSRAQLVPEVLVIHDSTKLKFGGTTRHDLDVSPDGASQSCLAHLSLCATREPRDVLGLLRLSSHRNPVRAPDAPPGKEGRKARVLSQPKEKRLSARWLEAVRATRALLPGLSPIHVMDCEADDYELFARMQEEKDRFVVRANFDRIVLTNELTTMSRALLEVPAQAGRKVSLSARKPSRMPDGNRKHPPREARQALVELGATRLTLNRPKTANQSLPKAIELNLVFVREPNPPPGVEAIEWRLWTTEPIDTPEQSLRIVDIYLRRWLIEEYIKALKSGCRVQERELETRDGLMRLMGLVAPVAWHMLRMREWTRAAPASPAAAVLPPMLLEVLGQAAIRCPLPPEPTVEQALLSIAGMGGHLKRNGPPGFLTLAKGYRELLLLAQGYALAQQQQYRTPFNAGASEDVSNQ